MTHADWLAAEYAAWVQALAECDVTNFKQHPGVTRMLGEVDPDLYASLLPSLPSILHVVDSLGYPGGRKGLSGVCLRMAYWGLRVLEQKPSAIVEIGGGVGQQFAVLRALGYRGRYYIMDLPAVQQFQLHYLAQIERETGLSFQQHPQRPPFDFVLSCYALGEFDDATKDRYIQDVVRQSRHGLVVWNPHSGASPDISFPCQVEDEHPQTYPGNKVLTW